MSKKNGSVTYVEVYNNQFYLAQEIQVMCIANANTRKETELIIVPKINKICGIAIAKDKILICTEFHKGNVY